jgi:putative transposase
MNTITKSRHSSYVLNYHIVWIPKYRRKFLTGDLRQEAEEIIKAAVEEKDWTLLALEVQPDHIHLFVSAPPTVAPAEIAKAVKGVSARRLLMRHPELAKKTGRGTLWAPSYYVGTAGAVSSEIIKRYIEECQDH